MACSKPNTNFTYGTPIQNTRHRPRRRNPFFSARLHRASELIQHPGLITFREVCLLAWALYASYRLYVTVPAVWNLLAVVDVRAVCGIGQSFMSCGWNLFWGVLFMMYLYLAEVVPWAVLCAVVVFVGEEVLRR